MKSFANRVGLHVTALFVMGATAQAATITMTFNLSSGSRNYYRYSSPTDYESRVDTLADTTYKLYITPKVQWARTSNEGNYWWAATDYSGLTLESPFTADLGMDLPGLMRLVVYRPNEGVITPPSSFG